MPTRSPVFRPAHLPPPEQRRAVYERDRGSAASRGYDHHWRKVRAVVLAGEPLCRACMERGMVTAATEVDHILTIKDRPDLRLDLSNLRPMCRECHHARTSSDGGKARRR